VARAREERQAQQRQEEETQRLRNIELNNKLIGENRDLWKRNADAAAKSQAQFSKEIDETIKGITKSVFDGMKAGADKKAGAGKPQSAPDQDDSIDFASEATFITEGPVRRYGTEVYRNRVTGQNETVIKEGPDRPSFGTEISRNGERVIIETPPLMGEELISSQEEANWNAKRLGLDPPTPLADLLADLERMPLPSANTGTSSMEGDQQRVRAMLAKAKEREAAAASEQATADRIALAERTRARLDSLLNKSMENDARRRAGENPIKDE